MLRRFVVLSCCLLPLGCAGLAPKIPDTARLAPGALGTGADPDVTAVNLAQWAFADPSRTRGRPVESARASAAMDYIAGALYTSPRWANLSPLTKEQLLQGRVEVRQALGVVPGTASQLVVDRLTAAGNALASGDQGAAVRQLGPPVFASSGEQVLARLGNMPYLRMANVATMRVGNELFETDSDEWH